MLETQFNRKFQKSRFLYRDSYHNAVTNPSSFAEYQFAQSNKFFEDVGLMYCIPL